MTFKNGVTDWARPSLNTARAITNALWRSCVSCCDTVAVTVNVCALAKDTAPAVYGSTLTRLRAHACKYQTETGLSSTTLMRTDCPVQHTTSARPAETPRTFEALSKARVCACTLDFNLKFTREVTSTESICTSDGPVKDATAVSCAD